MEDQPLDIGAARRLADDLAQKLAALQGGDPKLDALRAEVETLRAMLAGTDAAKARHSRTGERLRAIESAAGHAALEMRADGFKVGAYLAEIGRILGLD